MSQPVEVYPNPVTRQQNSSHSNGSFGPVFIVLAVIVVLSAVACTHHRPKATKQSHGLGPKEWESRQKPSFDMRDGDIEFGFDKRTPSAKVANNGGGKGKPPHHNGGHRPEGHRPEVHRPEGHRPEVHRPEVRFADNV
ncbi:hypothetical protein Pfo_009386 [Paulownia fortunei]|nr:hypothetical protein Pfo_009386 [Paulownia fortunei]